MKRIFFLLVFLFAVAQVTPAQNVGISDYDSTFTPDNSAALEIKSISRGVLVPRLTTAQRTAISSPATGLLVFDSDLGEFYFYESGWQSLSGGGGGSDGLQDADADTKVEVERTADEDVIRFKSAGVDRMSISDTIVLGSDTSHTYILHDGSLRMVASATTFTDLVVPVTATTRGGTKDPDLNMLYNDGSSSQGVFAFDFDDAIEEELYFMVQMPHSWLIGSSIYPHVHWTTSHSNLGSTKVRWGLEYTWVNVGGTAGNTSFLYGEDPIPAASPVTTNLHTITPLGAIVGTGKELSSILVCRIFRDASHSNDNYISDAALLMIDFHFEEDSFGSRGQYEK